MKSFRLSLIKFILGIFLFGLAVWANPIEGYCATSYSVLIPGTTFTSNTIGTISNSEYFLGNVNENRPLLQYGLVPFSSFDVDVSFSFHFEPALISDYIFSGYCPFEVYVLFSSSDGGAYQQLLFSSYYTFSFSDSVTVSSYHERVSCSVDGIPTGIRIKVLTPNSYKFTSNQLNIVDGNSSYTSVPTISDLFLFSDCTFTNFSFDSSSGGGSSSTVINNTTSNLVPIGYSNLNFGLNGSTYFLGASRIFEPSYLSPLMFSYDFANSVQGVVSSAPLTLAMGGFDSPPNTSHASPIAVIGDTRAGEYELTIALCLSTAPSSWDLQYLVDPSQWGFEFNRGYSGQQFGLPSNTRISYTNFTDSKTGYVYTSVYFYFTTPDYFDSFLIRKAPTLYNIRVGAFAFNKYTGTISDQLTQSNQQWDYQNPSHSSFSSANSSAASTVSAFSNIEADAFNNLDTAMSGAGVNDFNINVISTPLATVSAMINQTYNILPDLVKWLILAILVIGIFAVIISANNYVNKD